MMIWTVLFANEFAEWLTTQDESLRAEVAARVDLLETYGPHLGRPHADSLKGSRHSNMKELRIQCKGKPWRILFAFDPKRRSILLVGGNKQGDKRWYDTHIPIADDRFDKHLKYMELEHGYQSKRLH